jgi:hypothetical protein
MIALVFVRWLVSRATLSASPLTAIVCEIREESGDSVADFEWI